MRSEGQVANTRTGGENTHGRRKGQHIHPSHWGRNRVNSASCKRIGSRGCRELVGDGEVPDEFGGVAKGQAL